MPSRRFSPNNAADGQAELRQNRLSASRRADRRRPWPVAALARGLCLAGLLMATPAVAQIGDSGMDPFPPGTFLDQDPIEAPRQSQGPGFVDVTLKLAFVLGLIYLAALGWKRFGRPMGGTAGDEVVRLWATKNLGLGSDVYLIEVGDRMLLVGRSGSGLSTLTAFDDPAVIEDLKATCVVPMVMPAGGHWLDRWRTREGGR